MQRWLPSIVRSPLFWVSRETMITSKLTSRARTTIPQAVRAALRLREGDEIVYEIRGDRVVLSRAQKVWGGDDQLKTFTEWYSDADRKAYSGL